MRNNTGSFLRVKIQKKIDMDPVSEHGMTIVVEIATPRSNRGSQ
jgi:hypothetical protein